MVICTLKVTNLCCILQRKFNMNNGTYIVNLGADPEKIELGGRELYKLRCADKTPGKRSIVRWFTAMVGGPDVTVANRLAKGDTIVLTGTLTKEEYSPKKPRYKGEKIETDNMPFAKILQVVKSDTFFGRESVSSDEAPRASTAEVIATDGAFPTDEDASAAMEGL